jgi:hypothetical protein
MHSFAFFATVILLFSHMASAADSPAGRKVQQGQFATARLLATARLSTNTAPDGMRFLFLITRTSNATGQFTLKETRDFLVDGLSYQEKSQSELGKRFEPTTVFETAGQFFHKQPGMRSLAPEDIRGSYILSLTIGGTKLSPGATTEVTIHVGYDKQVEPFTFRIAVPPVPGSAPKM